MKTCLIVAWRAAILLAALAALQLEAGAKDIRLRNEVIKTEAADAQSIKGSASNEKTKASGLFLIQFTGPLEVAWRSELRGWGVILLRTVPEEAFVAQVQDLEIKELRKLSYVRWVGPYRPEHKVHRKLSEAQARAGAGDDLWVSALLSPAATAGDVALTKGYFRKLQQASGNRFGTILRGRLPPGRLNTLADSPAVLWIEPGPNPRLYDEVSAKILGGDAAPHLTFPQASGYSGQGVTVAVADSGLHNGDAETMHPDLYGRVSAFFHYGSLTDAADEHSHGTHVAGIIAGDGAVGEVDENNALYGLGVAPMSQVVAQRIFDGVGNYEPPPSFEVLTRDAKSAGAEIGSNSWGDDTQGRYDLSAAEFDALVRDADAVTPGDQPYILEFSAGNAGPGEQTVGSPAVAKNVIATGASQNDRPDFFIYAEGIDAMADFSSRGPCEDGRIKPDVVAPGTWIASLMSASASSENAWADISAYYIYMGGTSQAGPHASGAAAVFVQYYRDLFGATPSPALVKAALINSAVDMPSDPLNYVETPPVPNNDEGWGRIDLTQLIEPPMAYDFVDQTALLATGQSYERRFVITDSTTPLKITLAYTDVPGLPAATPALVNDLDLEVVAPDGVLYRGNQFSEGESLPGALARDAINNVEGVLLGWPMPGEYVARVIARSVAEDARVDTPAVDQDFALVISGEIPVSGAGTLFLDRNAYRAADQMRLRLVDYDLAGRASVAVTVRSATEPGGESVTLRAANSYGAFTSTVATATGPAAADGRLQIAHGDWIEAVYADPLGGAGYVARARGDFVPPVITGVYVTNEFGRTVVKWLTDEAANSVVYFGLTGGPLTSAATNTIHLTDHAVVLRDIVAGRRYSYFVVSADEAGNLTTNNNSGQLFSFVAVGPPLVLLVEAYVSDTISDDIPLSSYTELLSQNGYAFDVWDIAGGRRHPTVSDLEPYRAVIWRLNDGIASPSTLSAADQVTIRDYVNSGGSFFMASMEQLTRLGSGWFSRDILQVQSFEEDGGVPAIYGVPGNAMGNGVAMGLDYGIFYTWLHDIYMLSPDLGDPMTISTNATAFLQDQYGSAVGMSYPRVGLPSLGRVVFLSIPLEAMPTSGAAPNNRAALMGRILNFLTPGEEGVGAVAIDRYEYTIPSLVTVEVADTDLIGLGQTSVRVSSGTEPAGRNLTLFETTRRGLFRGTFYVVGANTPGPDVELRVRHGDQFRVEYADASLGRTVMAMGLVETVPPRISGVACEPDYIGAYITWSTSEPTDSLVQFGESLLLERTAYSSRFELDHGVVLEELQPDRVYYYQVVSRDPAGNVSVDDNGGQLYSFRTLTPMPGAWADNGEFGDSRWTVVSAEESESSWKLGVPQGIYGLTAHSPVNAWSCNLSGARLSQTETYLVSPAIYLANGNEATLRYWQNYNFPALELDIFEFGQLLLFTNNSPEPVVLLEVVDSSGGWEEVEIDLTPYMGRLVYVAWYYFLFSLDYYERPGWLVDDVSLTVSNVYPGVIRVSNNLAQAGFDLTGPMQRSGSGRELTITNAPPGQYQISYHYVPFYDPPPSQTRVLGSLGEVAFTGVYAFADANRNQMSDAWEQSVFGEVSPSRTQTTDSDSDGFSDYAEFMAGTNPLQANSRLQIRNPQVLPEGGVRLFWPSELDRSYRVEGSGDAVHWQPLTGWLRATAYNTSLTLSQPLVGSNYLFRLEVQP